MHPSLRSRYLQLEADLNQLFQDLSAYTPEQLSTQPEPGKWSAIEVIQHLMASERKSLAYIKKKTSYPDSLKKAGFKNEFRKILLKVFLNAPIKFKAPAVVDESNFVSDVSYEELMEDWRKIRQELFEFLETVPDEWLNKQTYRHAVAGRLTFEGMLIFFREHLLRHRKQILRGLKKVASQTIRQ